MAERDALIRTWRRSLGAVLGDESFVLPQQGMGPMVGLYWFRGSKGLQPSKVNVISQGGMASAFAKGFGGQVGGHVRAVPFLIPHHLPYTSNRATGRSEALARILAILPVKIMQIFD